MPGPLISGVLYDRLLCWLAVEWLERAGIDGPRGFLPFIMCGFGEFPSREGARGIAGAVYRLWSSPHGGCGVPDLGNGYAGVANILLAVLVRDEAGDSATGEK